MAPWPTATGKWYEDLYATVAPAEPRRIAIALTLGPSIQQAVTAAVTRCGHKCVGVQDAPDLIIATWWKDNRAKLALPPGVPVVHWWVGSDAHHTTPHSRDVRHNWVVSPWLARLLAKRAGVAARVIPLTPALEPRLLPRSKERRVLAYCPQHREHKYCWDELVEIARTCPDLEFRILRRSGTPPAKNMAFLPSIDYEDMPAVYAGTRLLLRLTPSDGSSLSVMEALGFGRHAVWNWWAPGATHVSNTREAVEAILRLIHAPAYEGGVVSGLELRAQADHVMSAAIDGVFQ